MQAVRRVCTEHRFVIASNCRREGYSVLPVHFELSALQITDIITSIVTN